MLLSEIDLDSWDKALQATSKPTLPPLPGYIVVRSMHPYRHHYGLISMEGAMYCGTCGGADCDVCEETYQAM